MLKHLTKQFGLAALGIFIMAGCIEIRGAVHDYKHAELLKYQIMLKVVDKAQVNTAEMVHLVDMMPADVMNNPLPVKTHAKAR